MRKRFFSILLVLCLCTGALLLTARAADGDLTISIKSPSGQSAALTLAPDTTIEALKAEIEAEFSISFADDGYWFNCEDLSWPDNRLETAAKTTLSDYGFQSGYTVHVEKDLWENTAEHPIHVFGLTISGGTGAPEPSHGITSDEIRYDEADFYWNYYYKAVYINTTKPVTISGTGEDGTNIIVNSGPSDWAYVTFDNLTLHNSAENCVTVNPTSYLCLGLIGTNSLTGNSSNRSQTVHGTISLQTSYSSPLPRLWINNTGTLTVTETGSGFPAIGNAKSGAVSAFTIASGTVTAIGGENAPGIHADTITVKGGTLTAVSGSEGYPGLLANTSITIADSMYVKAPAGGSVQENAYEGLHMVAVDAGTPAQTVVITAAPQAYTVTLYPNGGTIENEAQYTSYTFGTGLILPTPDRPHYTFAGWYERDDFFTAAVTEITAADTGDKVFYAKWDPAVYSVTLHTEGGTIENADSYTSYSYGVGMVLPTPVKADCTFLGWYAHSDFSGAEVTEISATDSGSKEFYAKWEPADDGGQTTTYYTLRYETGGGTEYADETYAEDTIVPLTKTPVRWGYEFFGWYLDAELTQAVSSVTLTGDTTVYAGWRKTVVSPNSTGVSEALDTRNHSHYLNGYPGNLFGPDDSMTRAQATQLFYNLLLNKEVSGPVSFTDVDANMWYADAVHTLSSLGVIQGVGDHQFAPDRAITRAEFTVIAMRFAQLDATGENIFSDVSENAWYYDDVVGSVQYGWITGYPDGTFRPNSTITRGEAAAIVNRMLGRSPDKSYIDSHADKLVQFYDLPSSHWAYYHIMEAANDHDFTNSSGEEYWQ